MSAELWESVDQYFAGKLLGHDPVFDALSATCEMAGLPSIQVTPTQGRFLEILARISGARRILELGTLGGYSTVWLARALPNDGTLVTLELDPHHAEVARANFARAGLADRITLRVGPALASLKALLAEGVEPFDFIFLDADKDNYPAYLPAILALSKPGTVLVADNVVRDGAVIEPENDDPAVRGVRAFLDLVAADPCLEATALQTVGGKGYDGFALIRVTAHGWV